MVILVLIWGSEYCEFFGVDFGVQGWVVGFWGDGGVVFICVVYIGIYVVFFVIFDYLFLFGFVCIKKDGWIFVIEDK